MPVAAVAVDIAPADAPQGLRQSLLDSCTQTVGTGACVEGADAPDAYATAAVTWLDDAHATIRVTLDAGERSIVRHLEFKTEDSLDERWTATGLVIGTLVTMSTDAPDAPVDPAQEPEPRDAAPAPQSEPPAPVVERAPEIGAPPELEDARPEATGAPPSDATAFTPRIWITLAAIAGPVFDRRPWRAGGELAVHAPIVDGPLFAHIGASHAQTTRSFETLRADWTTAFAGVGYVLGTTRHLAADVRLEALVQRFSPAAANDAPRDSPTSGHRWLGGARVGASGTWWPITGFGVTAGVSGRWLGATTDVRVNEKPVATEGPVTVTLRLGAAARF